MKRIKKFIDEYWPLIAVLALFAVMLAGCSRKTSVPVLHDTIYKSNTQYVDRWSHDSIYLHDSVWMTIKGDTIFVDRWHNKYIERIKHDSINFHDTIYQTNEKAVTIEKVKYKTPCIIWILLTAFAVASLFLIAILMKKWDDLIG